MAKDPAFLFYSGDFLTGTLLMSDEQVGRYIRLMCAQHQQRRLPESYMRQIMGGELDPMIMAKFKQDEEGFYNERLENETDKRVRYSQSRKANRASKKGASNSQVSSHMSEHMSPHMSGHMSPHMENENRNRNININRGVIGDENTRENVPKKPARHKHGEYKNVLLSDDDLEKWKAERPGDWSERIEALSAYMASTGKAYKNHLATMRNWARKDEANKPPESRRFREEIVIT